MKFTKEQTQHIQKHGIHLRVYETGTNKTGLVYIEVDDGHYEEFYHKTSDFLYYVLEGQGSFYLDGQETTAKAGDLIVAPAMTRINYLGKMKILLVTAPAWTVENEVHVRDIPKS